MQSRDIDSLHLLIKYPICEICIIDRTVWCRGKPRIEIRPRGESIGKHEPNEFIHFLVIEWLEIPEALLFTPRLTESNALC